MEKRPAFVLPNSIQNVSLYFVSRHAVSTHHGSSIRKADDPAPSAARTALSTQSITDGATLPSGMYLVRLERTRGDAVQPTFMPVTRVQPLYVGE